ncbi:uncharacterized protein FFB20_06352 [Fusarium fujikuroi]|nr:uncharacterized protein FFE2_00594 [Fusarium fujikuroi]SCN69589.1 uncharacterized protein FFC1_00591 [Fusarium fujikuroi]SCN72989.1 uncharacterized protein FFM5_00555 [Fusarium fujikuroi]SCN81156.1 uncharacterized protein FFB20_06352 [Fusarium fujikuroi]SCO28878.1 uncharacterized protein FFNC_00594 [Fusarium fujikuroi]
MSDGVGVGYHRNLWCMMNYDSCPPSFCGPWGSAILVYVWHMTAIGPALVEK